MIDVTNEFSTNMNKAESAEEVAAAIETYADAMEELKPKIEAMEEKYPDISPDDFPEELAEIMIEYEEMMVELQVSHADNLGIICPTRRSSRHWKK